MQYAQEKSGDERLNKSFNSSSDPFRLTMSHHVSPRSTNRHSLTHPDFTSSNPHGLHALITGYHRADPGLCWLLAEAAWSSCSLWSWSWDNGELLLHRLTATCPVSLQVCWSLEICPVCPYHPLPSPAIPCLCAQHFPLRHPSNSALRCPWPPRTEKSWNLAPGSSPWVRWVSSLLVANGFKMLQNASKLALKVVSTLAISGNRCRLQLVNLWSRTSGFELKEYPNIYYIYITKLYTTCSILKWDDKIRQMGTTYRL